ncbi:probable indole-3-acetic acid-amido synthetase GH3.1 [Mercurialis annua]|uniref:probable indole-3-acetic acid-amido synthetase GH3.1 n=1 Tax=Mercurialis annua TaxID=3986 RepID=UPI002160F39C|nr:probable indole-3-acetic acid-amido synthetase GH3.1 [Mercurialis annua]
MAIDNPPCDRDAEALQLIEEMTSNADSIQEQLLAQILEENKEVEYFKRFKLDGATDRKTFKSKIPVITYEDIRSDIQRIADGDRSTILSVHPILEFFTSSGTSSDERKLIPVVKGEIDRRLSCSRLTSAVINSSVPGSDKGKGLYFYFVKSETRTAGGLVAQPATSYYLKSDKFKKIMSEAKVYTSPIESILCPDSFQSMYTQLLCGLLDRHQVVKIGAVFSSSLIRIIKFLQLNWQELVHDIMSGTLNKRVIDPSIRNCIDKILKPDPEFAELIRVECSKENWEGIIKRIWPGTKYLDVIVTGGMAQHVPTLEYYSGGLPLASICYASSECSIGINLNPLCKPSDVSYTIIPNTAYFEFLPHDCDSSGLICDSPPKLVDLVDVEVGKEYEIVVTTFAGLYRYRVGDILRVSGFHNSSPQFQFIGRKNVLLGININETELQIAIDNAAQILSKYNTSVVEYTTYADTKTDPSHYVIYLELLIKDSSSSLSNEIMSQCCLAIEESLNSVYRQGRFEYYWLGPLEIRVVKIGTFEELMDYSISSRGASINQYKVPRCVNLTSMVEILDSNVLSAYFSPSVPYWTLEKRR